MSQSHPHSWPHLRRLRISLSAAHSTEDVEALAEAIRGCGVALPEQSQKFSPAAQSELDDASDGDADTDDAVSVQPASADGLAAPWQIARSRL